MEQIPFYMTFPMQNLYVMEMEYEKDIERMKSLYPTEVGELMSIIEERCDELEFEGSRMFDEEPDRYMIQSEVDRICEKAGIEKTGIEKNELEKTKKLYFDELSDYSMVGLSCISCGNKSTDKWLSSIVGILFTNELYRRRCRHRRCSRWW